MFVQFLTRKMEIFTCAIKFCRRKGTSGDGNSGFFRFPEHSRVREIWHKNTGIRPEDINTCTRICEIHFVESDVYRRFGEKRLKFSASPTLNLDGVPKKYFVSFFSNLKNIVTKEEKIVKSHEDSKTPSNLTNFKDQKHKNTLKI